MRETQRRKLARQERESPAKAEISKVKIDQDGQRRLSLPGLRARVYLTRA